MNRGRAHGQGGARLAGVDLGGTWVRVSVTGGPPRAFKGPAPGPARLPELLERLWRGWRVSRRDLATLGVASRGVWTRAERQSLARRLSRFAPRVVVISDVEAAYLAALGPSPGVLLLAGTGSIALGRDRRGRQGDRGARRIVRVAQCALADLVEKAAPRDRQRRGVRLTWAGGLLSNREFRAGVWRELRRRGVRITPVPPRATAATPSAWLPGL